MANVVDIIIPDLGDFSDVDVVEILVKPGDEVAREDGLITLETDKAAMDVPAPDDGVIEELSVKAGDTVNSGDVIGRLEVKNAGEEKPAGEDEAKKADATQEKKPAGEDEAKKADAAEGEKPAGEDEAKKADATQEEKPAGEDEAKKADAAEEEEPAGEAEGAKSEKTGPTSEEKAETQILRIPDLGEFEDVDVVEVHVSAGSEVAVDDPLVTLETDKAAMDVPSTAAGTIESVNIEVGDKVSEGSEIAVIKARAESPEDKEPQAEEKEAQAEEKEAPRREQRAPSESEPPAAREPEARSATQRVLPPIDEAGFSKAHASPSVRKLARELGVDLGQVRGSGRKKRILHDDVKAFVKAILTGERETPAGPTLPRVPVVDFSKFGEIETEPLTRIQKIAGPRLQASWINLPHVTQHDLADITALEAKRQELKEPAKDKGIRLTPLAFIMKACIATLKEFPKANASLAEDGESLVVKKYFHLGFAADTENGLMVPVIRDADRLDVYELAQALGELSAAARDGKLKAEQLQGASFTISSLGGIGGTAFTPIVNAPEVAILGVSRSRMQPVWNGSEFVPRLMLPISLSYDHRVIDGAYAVRFTTHLCRMLSNVEALLEATP